MVVRELLLELLETRTVLSTFAQLDVALATCEVVSVNGDHVLSSETTSIIGDVAVDPFTAVNDDVVSEFLTQPFEVEVSLDLSPKAIDSDIPDVLEASQQSWKQAVAILKQASDLAKNGNAWGWWANALGIQPGDSGNNSSQEDNLGDNASSNGNNASSNGSLSVGTKTDRSDVEKATNGVSKNATVTNQASRTVATTASQGSASMTEKSEGSVSSVSSTSAQVDSASASPLLSAPNIALKDQATRASDPATGTEQAQQRLLAKITDIIATDAAFRPTPAAQGNPAETVSVTLATCRTSAFSLPLEEPRAFELADSIAPLHASDPLLDATISRSGLDQAIENFLADLDDLAQEVGQALAQAPAWVWMLALGATAGLVTHHTQRRRKTATLPVVPPSSVPGLPPLSSLNS